MANKALGDIKSGSVCLCVSLSLCVCGRFHRDPGCSKLKCVVLCPVLIVMLRAGTATDEELNTTHACIAGNSTGDPSSWFATGLREVLVPKSFPDQPGVLWTGFEVRVMPVHVAPLSASTSTPRS